jgi:hypothetical protein
MHPVHLSRATNHDICIRICSYDLSVPALAAQEFVFAIYSLLLRFLPTDR